MKTLALLLKIAYNSYKLNLLSFKDSLINSMVSSHCNSKER